MKIPRLLSVLAPVRIFFALFLLEAITEVSPAAQVDYYFTYQGRLKIGGGSPDPSELFDFRFSFFDVPTGGIQVTDTISKLSVPCPDGLFTVALNGGSNLFNGDPRWLQLEVRPSTNPSAPYTLLSPRQQITSAPYALHAARADLVADGSVRFEQLAADAVGNVNLQTGAVTSTKIADGNLVRSLNGLKDQVTLSADEGLALIPNGNDLRIAIARSCNDYTNCYWNLLGNGNITAGVNYLGTVAGELDPLELRVSNNRALYIVPAATPNLIGGYSGNNIQVGVIGTHIGGGGEPGSVNAIAGNYDTIGGGSGHTIAKPSNYATIGGGSKNTISTNSSYSTIGGGDRNTVETGTPYATVGGGTLNSIQSNARWSAVAGGVANSVGNDVSYGFVGGGTNNHVVSGAAGAAIVGGGDNTIQTDADNATVGGGSKNTVFASTPFATIPGGQSAGAVNYGQFAYASGPFTATTPGGAQLSFHVLRRSMTVNATNELFLDGDTATRRMNLRPDSTWTFDILVAGRTDAGLSAGYRIAGLIRRPAAGAISFVGAPVTTLLGNDMGGSAFVEADAANNALVIKAVGAVQPTRWVATVRTSEVIY